jgi:serine phosphatase RsbU (regulator of sigma subunit)
MTTTQTFAAELSAQENSREMDLEEARSIQGLMLPAEALCTGQVTVAHEFQPAAEVGGDFLDYFSLADAALAVGTLRSVHKTGQSPANDPFGVERLRELCHGQAVATPRESFSHEFLPRWGSLPASGDAVSISRAGSGLSAAETLVEKAPHVEDAHGAGLFN